MQKVNHRILLVPFVILCVLFSSACRKDKVPPCTVHFQSFSGKDKIKGVNLDASIDYTTDTVYDAVLEVNATWVSIVPFGYMNTANDQLWWGTQGYWGMSDEGLEALTNYAKSRGLKVMIKPQVLIDGGSIFTGHFEQNSEQDWLNFESQYRSFILHYLQMGIAANAELFCIGTEWEEFATQRPEFWRSLIAEVKGVFSGKLTYAANWDEYNEIEFWDDLDLIGVDAYFRISSSETPTKKEIVEGWEPHIASLQAFSCKQERQILFTELGYRSTNKCAKDPWNTEYFTGEVNLVGQANAYAGLFEAVWNEDWFAGGLAWKWFANHPVAGGENDNRYTPQNKPAQLEIKEFYGAN